MNSLFFVLFFLIFSAPAFADTCQVGFSSGNTHSTIQEAIDDTTCSQINLGEKNFYENLVIDRTIILQGTSRTKTDLDGSSGGPVITVTGSADVMLADLTIQNGASTDNGGGIKAITNGSLTLKNVLIKKNTAQGDGGAIYLDGNGTIAIDESVIRDNSADDDGGGLYMGGNSANAQNNITILDMKNTSVVENVALDKGGGMFLDERSKTIIFNSTVGKNSAARGGAIYSNAVGYLFQVSIAENSSTTTKALTGGGEFSLASTYIAKNTGGDCNFDTLSLGGNLDSDNTCNFTNAACF